MLENILKKVCPRKLQNIKHLGTFMNNFISYIWNLCMSWQSFFLSLASYILILIALSKFSSSPPLCSLLPNLIFFFAVDLVFWLIKKLDAIRHFLKLLSHFWKYTCTYRSNLISEEPSYIFQTLLSSLFPLYSNFCSLLATCFLTIVNFSHTKK